MKMEIPNKVILKAHRDWGDWYRAIENDPIFFDDWLKEKWGLVLENLTALHRKPKGFYNCETIDEGKAALFMLKYYD